MKAIVRLDGKDILIIESVACLPRKDEKVRVVEGLFPVNDIIYDYVNNSVIIILKSVCPTHEEGDDEE